MMFSTSARNARFLIVASSVFLIALVWLLTMPLYDDSAASAANSTDRSPAADPFYPDFSDLLTELQDLASSYPSIVDYQVLGDATHSSRDLVALKISDNVGDEEDEPAWIFTGFVHGSEHLGMRVVLDLAEELASGYGSDADVTDWVDAYEIWIVANANPWGYDHDSSGGSSDTGTRKNGEHTTDANTSGVDLARNYDFRWDQAPTGPSATPCSTDDPECSRFKGPEPFSENESQALRDLFEAQRPVFGITFHQGTNPDGGEILRPWSGSGSDAPPDDAYITDIADLYADWVFDSRLTGDFCSGSLTDPDGDPGCTHSEDLEHCEDLCWEPDHGSLSRYGQPSNWYYSAVGTFDYTIEVSDRTFNGDFMHDTAALSSDEQDYYDISAEFARNHVDAIKDWFDYFLTSTGPDTFTGPGITGHITDAVFGTPIAATIEVSGYTSSLIEDRTADPAFGRYYRLLPAGTHQVTVSKPGYQSWTGNISVGSGALTELDVALTPDLELILPNDPYVAWVGEPDNPRAFTARLRIGSAGDPCINNLPFEVSIKDGTGSWIEATTGVQACVQDTYWISVQAPADTEGDFVTDGIYDLRVELDQVSGESADSIRYTDREEDVVLVMDVSGSMGDDGKLTAAQEAATLLVHELADNDQGALVAFEKDATTPFELATMTTTNQILLIAEIDNLTDGGSTSIGDGLDAALDELDSVRADPDHHPAIVLLSDGVENESLYWSEVQTRTADHDCVVNVVALGPTADEVLLEEISEKGTADTADDGWYMYASITDVSSRSVSAHWPNELAGVYDEIARSLAQRERILRILGVAPREPVMHPVPIDPTVDEAVFALKWSGDNTQGKLELQQPNGTWITYTMPGVEHTTGSTDEVYRIANPMPGVWQARVGNLSPQQEDLYYILLVSGQTPIEFEVYTTADLAPVRQGQAVHILGTLTANGLPITGANVTVRVEGANGKINTLRLFDDGMHDDGAAGDGFYVNVYDRVTVGDWVDPQTPELDAQGVRGSYTYHAVAKTPAFIRGDSGGFAAVRSPDSDLDGMPTIWELAHGLNPGVDDSTLDPDLDGLNNGEEFDNGTDPHDSDTDDGGESDGSEVNAGRDPLWIDDDMIIPVISFSVSPLPQAALISWTPSPSHTSYLLWRQEFSLNNLREITAGDWILVSDSVPPTGSYIDDNLLNGVQYLYKLAGKGPGGEQSASTEAMAVTPVADPFPPLGLVLINNGDSETGGRPVTLNFVMTDTDAVEVKIASGYDEGTDELGGSWRPFESPMPWTIPVEVEPGDWWEVLVQFRDAAGNPSPAVSAQIRFMPKYTYLPLVLNQSN